MTRESPCTGTCGAGTARRGAAPPAADLPPQVRRGSL